MDKSEQKGSDSPEVELTNERFDDLDINEKTKKVLKAKGYTFLTKVQSKVLPLALEGKNLVIQSPTGSGKTLCFLLPAVKLLFEEGYSGNLPVDANLLGCICLAPTRELASQSAIQMKDLATPLKLNAGCCIGGIRDKYDKKNASRLHILTGTPGRILALLSSQALPDTANVKLLILDEADRLIDSGFRNTIIDIVDMLPTGIQFMFFSATIKSSLKDLCNILLDGINYDLVCLGADADLVAEAKLRQEYLTISQSLKMTALFYILSKNQNKRIIVFLSTCKHVRFVYEVFKRLIPAIPMTELHGKQSQNKRMEQFTRFAAKQQFGCIFTTDVAARGIDFPSVDWVIQLDLPDSVSTYTHRVGRTGRLTIEGVRNFGRAIIFVSEHETDFVEKVKENGITLHNQTKLMAPLISRKETYVLRKMQAILAKESWIKEMAQRATIAYLRYLNTRQVAKLTGDIIVEELKQLALSMGLPNPPNVQVVEPSGPKKSKLNKLKEKIKKRAQAEALLDSGEEEEEEKSGHSNGESEEDEENEEEEDVLKACGNADEDIEKFQSTLKKGDRDLKGALTTSRKFLRLNKRGDAKIRGVITHKEAEKHHTFFSDDEDEVVDQEMENIDTEKRDYIEKLRNKLAEAVEEDKEHEHERLAAKRQKHK
ncbi:DEAD box ATP-dependent RNA helicase family member protein [Theileria equi strain WA]|uniref:ATP-dependent RNA helicase n=1 Tax=Theileria equi strain WA TaxID=1537102 RepID=L0AUY0_THEEQ|nr:DEAD box ATP-dependent RNA helicase family member protein [Theileria equi strain WA]AFZ79402.1 DEAD box ATP-dependent RNA helicase family member protein [Theileria equi strain WA]|eukprot:XP_004829068.1 DEAD box ATP-dependent RNA helicase family member protein [Theileria equi strain WA]